MRELMLIEFSLTQHLCDDSLFPKPYPAPVPDWLRDMPGVGAESGLKTVKACRPFLDALTAGYIIPTFARISLQREHGKVTGEFVPGSVHVHTIDQFPSALPIVKVTNPWLIRTPPGYSTLFLSWDKSSGLIPLSGIVDTDTLYREVNFPCALWLGKVEVPKGFPLIQAIPFKRDDWEAREVPLDLERYTKVNEQIKDGSFVYREEFWNRKRYGAIN